MNRRAKLYARINNGDGTFPRVAVRFEGEQPLLPEGEITSYAIRISGKYEHAGEDLSAAVVALRQKQTTLTVTPPNISKTPAYQAYENAIQRCTNPKNQAFKDYGGRGIKFLFQSFDQFFAEIGPRPSRSYTLDRINNNGHYER